MVIKYRIFLALREFRNPNYSYSDPTGIFSVLYPGFIKIMHLLKNLG